MNAQNEVLAIIPARGGSKSIPRKNLRLVGGLPLIAHSIRHAREAAEISRVVVSTDDAEIADVATAYGAEVVLRPAAISGDLAPSEAALHHVLTYLRETEDYCPAAVVFLQATSPVRNPSDLDGAVRKLWEEGADSLFSACRLNWFAWRLEESTAAPLNYDYRQRPMRQQAPVDIIETGSFYVFKPWVLLEGNCRFGGRIAVYMTDFRDALQIDEPEDLPLIERFLPKGMQTADMAHVRLLVLDFDGVLTDNHVWVGDDGREEVRCSRADSLGIHRLRLAGVEVVVLSMESNPVVQKRCQKMGIECLNGVTGKGPVLNSLMRSRNLTPDQVAYVGNDVNDRECLEMVGWPIVVGDGVPELRALARLITRANGGDGAVREVCDWILGARESLRSKVKTAILTC